MNIAEVTKAAALAAEQAELNDAIAHKAVLSITHSGKLLPQTAALTGAFFSWRLAEIKAELTALGVTT